LRRPGSRRPLRQGDRRRRARARHRHPVRPAHRRVRARRRQGRRHCCPHRRPRRSARRGRRGARLEHGQGPGRRFGTRVRGPRRPRPQGSPRRVAALRRRLTMAPETRYARSGDLNIAYQVTGDGPLDLVYVPGWVSNIELMWDEPAMVHFLERLASFSRLILFDKRGTGLSDRVSNDELPTLEQRMDDVRAVLEAVGSERAALFGHSEGGNMCVLFAATYPERTTALITLGSFAKRRDPDDDYPWAPTAENREEAAEDVERNWGHFRPEDTEYYAPSRIGDDPFVRTLEQYLRRGASPGAAAALLRMNSYIDIRHVLPTIQVPTLVLHRTGDHDVNVAEGRYLAAKVPGAKFVE